MAEKSGFQVDLPEGLRNKLASLQRKLFVVDTAIALSGVIAGLVVSWMLVYISDRFWETPFWARGLFALAGVFVAGIFAWPWVQHWLVHRRHNRCWPQLCSANTAGWGSLGQCRGAGRS